MSAGGWKTPPNPREMGAFFTSIWDALFGRKLELVLLGLENSGKSTLLQVISGSVPIANGTLPTLGSQEQHVQHDSILIKVWDIGGQERFRDKWVLYAEHADVILFVVDCSDVRQKSEEKQQNNNPNFVIREKLRVAKRELHTFLENEALTNIPVIVVSNKCDVQGHLQRDELQKALNLDYIDSEKQAVQIIEISALRRVGINQVYDAILRYSKPT